MNDLVERLSAAERRTDHENMRPKDAATLIVIDRAAGGPFRVLMGRRHARHVFYPGAFVFPGGRVDPHDSRVPLAAPYEPAVLEKLLYAMKGPKTEARARAFAVSAIREAYEEAGIFVAKRVDGTLPRLSGDWAVFAERGLLPDLSPMRLIGRAITPPRRPRRFDARFLACFADAIADRLPEGVGPSGELEGVAWVTFEEAKALKLPTITLTILDELADRLSRDPNLEPDVPVPFYWWKHGKVQREMV